MAIPMTEGLVDFLIDCRAAGPADVTIPGDTMADVIGELLRLARTSDELLDWADDWRARAEAWASQVTYLGQLVEHQQQILAYLNGESEDPDTAAVHIEADNIVLFSQDTLRAVAEAGNTRVSEVSDSYGE
jgi:hypothetical protein